MPRALEATIQLQGTIAVVALHGEMSAGAEEALTRAYRTASEQARRVLFEFSDVDYINSTGIAMLVTILRQARQDGVQLMASGLTEHYRLIFEITRLAEVIAVFPDQAAALASEPSPASEPAV